MPNLFTLPGPRSGASNFLAENVLGYGSNYTVPAGSIFYASLPNMFDGDYNYPTFTNYGTLWNIATDGAGVIAGYYIPSITNTGTMIADAPNGNAWTIFVGSGGFEVFNSGSIYAIANGNAVGIAHWDPGVTVQNTGLIAAYAPNASVGGSGGVGQPIGVAMFNGGNLINGAGGRILAEGCNTPTAVIFGRGSLFGYDTIQNDGRIEALSTVAGQLSYGISAGGVTSEIINFVNNGLLKADVAWSSYGDHPQYAPMGMDRLTNFANGTIIGRIETGRGEDSLVNMGAINGYVALGDEDDYFDTSTGTFTGAVDLGWHNDIFMGSVSSDVATGNRGNDLLSGNGGNDLLLGGSGQDEISGGAGNDGLYGELGADHLRTEGGDRAYGGDGDDLLEAGDLSFALVSGGAGHDTLRFDMASVRLNLGAAIGTGRLEGIEQVELKDNQQLAIGAGNATALAGGKLEVVGSGTCSVALVGAWIEGAPSIRDGVSCRSFSLGAETIYVQATVAVQTVASLPAGFGGLASIASGAAAPVAGSVPGGELSNPVQEISWLHLDRPVVVEQGETWHATNASVIVGYSLSNGLVNGGVIETTSDPTANNTPTIHNDVAFILNTGTIRGIGSEAINVRGSLENWGTVEAITDSGHALAVGLSGSNEGLIFENHGTVSARSTTGAAIGVELGYFNNTLPGPDNANFGQIEAIGGAETIALSVLGAGTFLNDGTITASNSAGSGAADATAVLLYVSSPAYEINQLINHGTITGVTAIRSAGGLEDVINTGRIEGAVQLGDGADIITNAGTIAGQISMGNGNDVYLGSASKAGALADGGVGTDLLVGGIHVDRFEGGDGNDRLIGGGGADVLIGGAGADVFAYRSASDSVAAAADLIEGFETGIDKIDLSALAPSGVSLGLSGEITTITAQTANGTVTIRVSGTVSLSDIKTAPVNSVLTGTSGSEALVATLQVSEVRGEAGDDLLLGTATNDRLDGGAGADLLIGGAGNDVFVVDGYADRVIERVGEGVDQVLAYGSYALPDDVENITLIAPGSADGNVLDNVMRGSSGNDGLIGYGGNDILIGGLGADAMIGGYLGSDVFAYESVADSTAAAPDTIGGFDYGLDKIDLSAITVISISWKRVQTTFDSYEEVTVQTVNGPMKIKVTLNAATSGLSMSDFILNDGHNDVRNDFNGDGRSDILWRSNGGVITNWLGQANGTFAGNTANANLNVGPDWQIAGLGDFNGDGRDDVLWRRSNGQVSEWLGTANGGFGTNSAVAHNVGLDWHVAGIGDFNGDGRDDVLWRRDNGQLTKWLSTNDGRFASNSAVANNVGLDWDIAGIGDFNGDGRDDVLWRRNNGQMSEWLGTASGSFASNSVVANKVGLDWDIAGIGDFNGDGRDDVLWRHDNGQMSEWLGQANGSFASNSAVANKVGLDWDIAGIGDYNGDGRDDVLWRRDNGQMTEWLGQANGSFASNGAVAHNVGHDWHVQSPDLM